MLPLQYPEILFNRQMVYKLSSNTEVAVLEQQVYAVAIVFSFSESGTIADAEKEQLQKIMTACRLTEDTTLLINVSLIKDTPTVPQLKKYQVKTVITFGEVELSKNLRLSKNILQSIDGLSIIKAESLTFLLNHKPEREKLWATLKKVFVAK